MNKGKQLARTMGRIFLPLFFALLAYLLIWLALKPQINLVISAYNLISQKSETSFVKKEIGSTYDENAAKKTTDETDKSLHPISEFIIPDYDTQYGKLSIPELDIEAKLFFGDSTELLKNGVGQYIGSSFPGCGSTTLIAGHNHTFFKPLKNAEIGMKVEIDTNYGVYTYKISDIQVKLDSDKKAFDLLSTTENLVLYTCYPFGSHGYTPTRYYVYCEFVSGPQFDIYS